LLTIFFYENNFEEAFQLAREAGIKPFDLVVRLADSVDEAPTAFRRLIEEFVEEGEQELFESPQECLAWAEEHFDGLVSGDIGGNLLSKFSMLGRFHLTREAIDFLEVVLRMAIPDAATNGRSGEISAVAEYLRCVSLHAPFQESVAARPEWSTRFDVEAWRAGGFEQTLATYRLPGLTTFETEVPDERRRLIESKISAFGDHPSQLGKFTRTMFAHDLRRVICAEGDGQLE
jgi:hypothetical protein